MSYSKTRIPGLFAPSTTPGSVVFHGVTPGLRNIVLMGEPVETEKTYDFMYALHSCKHQDNGERPTFCVVEHAEAISMVVAEELADYDGMMLFN